MDDIVVASHGDQPAVTIRQLQALHEKQKQEIEASKQLMNEIVIPIEDEQIMK
jgi:CTP:molybdopterin cytidylyltransferase MocA